MKKKLVKVLGMVMITASILTGCGGDDTASKGASTSVGTSVSENIGISDEDKTANKNIEKEANAEESTIINEDIYSTYVSWTDAGLTNIFISEHLKSEIYCRKYDKDTLMMEKNEIEKYDSVAMSGNNVILKKEDGTTAVFKYDAKTETLTADGYCFYENTRDFTKNELQETEQIIDGAYTATLEGGYTIGPRQYARGTYTVEAQFSTDGTVTGIIRNERYFSYKYYIKGNTILYVEEDGDYMIGYYDKENDIITMNLDELVFTRQ